MQSSLVGGFALIGKARLGDSPGALAILRQGVLWSGRAVRRDPPEISVEGLLAVHLFVNRNELRSTHQNNIVETSLQSSTASTSTWNLTGTVHRMYLVCVKIRWFRIFAVPA
jgi:hypothetical protein